QHVVVAQPRGYERRLHFARSLQLGLPAQQEQLVHVGLRGRRLWIAVVGVQDLEDVGAWERDVVEERRNVRAPQRAKRGREVGQTRRGTGEDKRDRRWAPGIGEARVVER